MLRPGSAATVPNLSDKTARSRKKVDVESMAQSDLERLVLVLEEEMNEAAAELKFEYAARLRDEINELKRERREVG